MASNSKIEILDSVEDIDLVIDDGDDEVILDFEQPFLMIEDADWILQLLVTAPDVQVDTGAGNDSVTITDVDDAEVSTGDGDDTIVILHSQPLVEYAEPPHNYRRDKEFSAGMTNVDTGVGADSIVISNTEIARVRTGFGSDRLSIDFAVRTDIEYTYDSVQLQGFSHLGSGLISLGAGHDIAEFRNTGDLTVNSGSGHDKVSIIHGLDSLTTYYYQTDTHGNPQGSSVVDAGSGNDRISIEGALAAEVTGGRGDDNIHVNHLNSTFTQDQLYEDIISSDPVGKSSIYGRQGDDEILVSNLLEGVLVGGGGADRIVVSHGISYFNYATYDQTIVETLHAVGTSTIYGGTGDDEIIVSDALNCFMAGGSGADTFAITVDNLGKSSTYTIADLSAADTLIFNRTMANSLAELDELALVTTRDNDVRIDLSAESMGACLVILQGVGGHGEFNSLADLSGFFDLAVA